MDSEGMTLEELISEFIKLNPEKKIEPDKIKIALVNINEEYKQLIKALKDLKKEEMQESIINDIKIIIPNEPHLPIYDNDSDNLLIAKMINYNKKIFGFFPRIIQIISLLYFIGKDKKEGLIQQINTGEGKSLIISFLAVYIAKKRKKKVDILTSSPILAERDAKYFRKFYNKCGLSVDYTFPHNYYQKFENLFTTDNYECYNSDIVYGDALSFEGDFLRTSFMGLKGRGFKRKFESIIIDEIDNIALDNLKNTTELLDSFHGYKFIEYIYLFIYKTLTEIENKEQKNTKNIIEQKENILKILRDKSLQEFIKLQNENKIFIPKHLSKYIYDRLDDWCESAFIAKFIFNKNENYIIKKNENYDIEIICPIDFYNTGVTQENSVWSGLHQFLEIKEGKMLTEENLSSCYISNLSFFNKYVIKDNNKIEVKENNIYGLTGTVGSKYNIITLDKLYSLKVLLIPPFKKSKLIIEEPIIILSNPNNNSNSKNNSVNALNSEWRKAITEKTLNLIKSNRSVLIVYQYIKEVELMYKFMKGLKNSERIFNKIIKYSRSDLEEETEFLNNEIESKTLIIATNIAGRGTDIKISNNLNKKKGLHVILTYEPFNERIENQAFGRAARKGQNGSAGKIIICPFTNKEIIAKREEREKEESDFLINVYKFKIEVFENIFSKFSKYLENIYKENHLVKSNYNENDAKLKDQEILLLDIKERWGLFLIENNLNNIEKKYRKNNKEIKPDMFQNIEEKYNLFERKLRQNSFSSFLGIKNENEKTNNTIQYQFQNALYLNKSLNEARIDPAIHTDPYFTLGSYMFKLKNNLKIIIDFQKKKDLKNISIGKFSKEIKNTFNDLNNLLNDFVIRYQYYKDKSLELCDNSSDLINQFNTKIEVMKNIYDLMEQNRKEFDEFIKDNNILLGMKEIKFTNFIKTKIKINKLDEEYFMDFGFRLFILNANGNNCIIY
jgi:preprotein translocase subunit SecA